MNEVVTIVVNNLLEIVFAVLGASFTALVIPWLKDTGLPWLKEKRLYSIVKKFVEAAEKQAEAGTIDKATKKRFVVELLEANGIAKGLFLNLTQEELPRHGKKKHKYKKVKKNKSASRAPAGESIEQRPEEIDEREEFGHWEGDTVYSGRGKRKTTRALLTLTERKTRKEIIIAIPNRKAETVVKALDALERKLGARRFRAIFKSITFDNGTEFAAAEELERSCVNKRLPRTKVYFCHPYSSWERGTNENTNGMIRRRFPKGTNFAAVTNAQIAQAENWINNYPRKILGYKSSEIVFRECLRELGIAA